ISYSLYFILIAFLDIRDINDLIHIYLLDNTSPFILRLMFIGLVYYSLLHGIEVIARFSHIQFNIILFIFFSFLIIMIISNKDLITFNHFIPLLENGIKPLIRPTLFM